MKRRKQEKVTTYISTLTVNLGNNQATKFESNKITSESHNMAPKQHHVYPSTTHNSDAPQSYRQAQRSSGTYYQLTKSSPPNSNKEQPEPHQEAASENTSFRTASKQHHDSSTAKYLSSSSFDPPSYLRPTGGPYETTYTASFQGIRPHTTPYTLKPITLSGSYEFPSKILQDSSSGLESSPPNSNKEQPEPHQEAASENTSFRTASKQHHDSSTAKYLSSSSFDPPSYLRPTGGPYETTYTASFQGIRPHTTPYTLRPITLSGSYEFPSKILQDSSSGLESSPPNSNKEPPEPHQEASENYEFPSKTLQGSSSSLERVPYTAVSQRAIHKNSPQQWRSSNNKIGVPQTTNSSKEQPEPHQEVSENTSFRRNKTYFEELSNGRAGSSGSKSFTQYDQNQKKSKRSTAVSKEITSSITTTTTEEKKTLSGVKTEVKSTKPTTDYGETDWYLDLLLRMQALEMKQQNLHAQYDFLGKLANENKENLKQARDWSRYDADNYQVEAY